MRLESDPFPLTLALSPKERELHCPRWCEVGPLRIIARRDAILPIHEPQCALKPQHCLDDALNLLLPFPAYEALAGMELRLFQAVNVIALAGRRRREAIRPIKLDLRPA
jgi:hypothetical protein